MVAWQTKSLLTSCVTIYNVEKTSFPGTLYFSVCGRVRAYPCCEGFSTATSKAKKPDDWDDEEDGEWEAPMIDNPEYKGRPGHSLCMVTLAIGHVFLFGSCEPM